jgi:formylmethanofuran dehydrogenase subunit E
VSDVRAAAARRTEPWPEDAPCYACGEPIGPPIGKLITWRPVCPRCAWENIVEALSEDEPS